MTGAGEVLPGSEAALYAPVRALLVELGFEVKAEVHRCDVVAHREGEPPVVVELKRQLTLDLLLQGVDRLSITEAVYLAVPSGAKRKGRTGQKRWKRTLVLLRRLGLGLIVVDEVGSIRNRRQVKLAAARVVLEPGPYAPRHNARRANRLGSEFSRREGDPNVGGVTRRKIVTAYRQASLKCAQHLHAQGPSALKELREATGVQGAARLLQRDLYGWFERVERGVYRLTADGEAAVRDERHCGSV